MCVRHRIMTIVTETKIVKVRILFHAHIQESHIKRSCQIKFWV